MKLTFVIILISSLQLSANVFSQNTITLKMQSANLKSVMTQIEKKSNYRFLYNDDMLTSSPKINVNANNAAVTDVLENMFAGSGLNYRILNNNLVVITGENSAFADVRVTGRVMNADGAGIPNVSVKIKGSAVGTSTGADGSYAITVPEGATLVFSSIGYITAEEKLNGRTVINVVLNTSEKSLDEVVVVGYGTQRKRDLTGSINSVKGDEVAKMPGTNPIGSLQGKVPGLTIANSGSAGADPIVRIRGINSTNTASPVYVVDGILVDDIGFLNPADIESIDVLRDPSSIAIYGLRGANGVIAITSKKAARGKTRVTLTSSVGLQKVNNTIKLTDAAGFRKLYDQQLDYIQQTSPSTPDFDYRGYTGNTDWQNEILRTALITSHSLGVSNSTDRSTTYFNLGYTNQDGVVGDNNFERFIVRLNEEIKINNHIKVGGSFTGYHSVNTPQGVSITNALWAAPIVPVQYAEGVYYSMPSFQRAQVGNPIASLMRSRNTTVDKDYRIIGNIYAEINFLKHFTWKTTLYGDFNFSNLRSYNARPFAQRDIGEQGTSDTTVQPVNIFPSVTQNQSESKRFQQDHTLSFDKRIKKDHQISGILGFTTIFNSSSFVNANRRDTSVFIPNDPDLWYINIANVANPGGYSGGGGKSAIAGAFARGSYSYMGKYLLNATIRRDGSSKFAPDYRWGTFGSVGLGWVMSQENFFGAVKGIDFLKLRAAWGITGNSNGVPDNLYQPGLANASTAVFGNNIFTSLQSAYIVDPNIRWETVQGIDIGFDGRALRNRLNFEATFYDRTTTDILSATEIPNDNRVAFKNLGKITNRGIEIGLGWSDKIGRDISYTINGNFSYNKNEVNSLGDKLDFSLVGNSGANLTKVGQSIGYFYGYRQIGIYQSTADLAKMPAFPNSLPGDIAYADTNGDGVITPADRTYLGTPFPVYNFGGNINLGYKDFDFQIELQGVAGNKIYTQRRISNFAVLNYEANRLDAWTAPGTSNIEPIMDNRRGNNYLFSSYYLEPADYLRIRTLQVGYTLNSNLMKRFHLSAARVYLSGQNIANWSKVTGYSPEAQIGSIIGGGADNGAYPVPAIYSFGLNLTF